MDENGKKTKVVLSFKQAQIGQKLDSVDFQVTKEKASAYIDAVGETTSFYLDEETARAYSLRGLIVPPTIVSLFCRIFPSPEGTIHAGQELEFYLPIRVGDCISTSGRIEEKFEKKNRKFIRYSVEGRNQCDLKVFQALATIILPY